MALSAVQQVLVSAVLVLCVFVVMPRMFGGGGGGRPGRSARGGKAGPGHYDPRQHGRGSSRGDAAAGVPCGSRRGLGRARRSRGGCASSGRCRVTRAVDREAWSDPFELACVRLKHPHLLRCLAVLVRQCFMFYLCFLTKTTLKCRKRPVIGSAGRCDEQCPQGHNGTHDLRGVTGKNQLQ